mmetsp:Transcript_29042/g.77592  ORF Transcript_29042/g.77592 Transcript_29042/m.77592 type:complete len:202 (-) Transcript_29042:49-654(-)
MGLSEVPSVMACKSTSIPLSRAALLSLACTMAASPVRCASCFSCSTPFAERAASAAWAKVLFLVSKSSFAAVSASSSAASAAWSSVLRASTPPTLVPSASRASWSLACTASTTWPIIATTATCSSWRSSLGAPKAAVTLARSILRQLSGKSAACSMASLTPAMAGSTLGFLATGEAASAWRLVPLLGAKASKGKEVGGRER